MAQQETDRPPKRGISKSEAYLKNISSTATLVRWVILLQIIAVVVYVLVAILGSL
jgi:hypothetical protein